MVSARTTATAVSVMRKVLNGETSRIDIKGMKTPSHRAYAAIAWMLAHPDAFLDEYFHVLGRFDRILRQLAGGSGNYVAYSATARLHTSRSAREPGVPRITYKTTDRRQWNGERSFTQTLARVVILTPPEELTDLLPMKPKALPPTNDRLVDILVDLVLRNGDDVAQQVNLALGKRLNNK